jgi:hypothetical protein
MNENPMESSSASIAFATAFTTSGLAICLASTALMFIYRLWKRYRTAIVSAPTPHTSVIIEVIQSETPPTPHDSDADMCYICTERKASTILLNCRHQGVCLDCTKTLLRSQQPCPLCRGELVGLIHLLAPAEAEAVE